MKKTLFLLCALCAATTASAKEQWVQGVDKTGGWYDTNKTGNDDDGFCWAAADTNVISWWQEHNKPAAQAAAANGAPQTQEEIWDLYNTAFVNGTGHPASGLKWYFNGDKPQTPAVKDSSKGGYYKDLEVTVETVTKSIYSYDSHWSWNEEESAWVKDGDSSEEEQRLIRQAIAADLVSYLEGGYAVTLGMAGYDRVNRVSYKHAVTLWGVQVDDTTGLLTKMWITDSDDDQYTLSDGRPKYDTGDNGLITLNCQEDFMAFAPAYYDYLYCYGVQSETAGPEGNLWYQYYNNDYFYEFTAIKLTSDITAPEPATATLSLLALAGLAARRRRK